MRVVAIASNRFVFAGDDGCRGRAVSSNAAAALNTRGC
jgi:hypothetical protein